MNYYIAAFIAGLVAICLMVFSFAYTSMSKHALSDKHALEELRRGTVCLVGSVAFILVTGVFIVCANLN